jgi:hypothetical protein
VKASDESVDPVLTARRARFLAQQLAETAEQLESGRHAPWARRVLPALLGYAGAKREDRVAAMLFLNGLQNAVTLRLASLLCKRERGDTLNEEQTATLRELDAVDARLRAGEPWPEVGEEYQRNALLQREEWARAMPGKVPAGDLTAEHCLVQARASLALLFPEHASWLDDATMLEALVAFERDESARGGEDKWDALARILKKAGFGDDGGRGAMNAETLNKTWRKWSRGEALDELK